MDNTLFETKREIVSHIQSLDGCTLDAIMYAAEHQQLQFYVPRTCNSGDYFLDGDSPLTQAVDVMKALGNSEFRCVRLVGAICREEWNQRH
jgi:hypothetical protein